MSGRLEGKKIVVTAAGQGIGKATAIAFHNEGAQVIATDLNEKTLADLNKEYPNIKIKTLDSTDNKAILDFVKTGEPPIPPEEQSMISTPAFLSSFA